MDPYQFPLVGISNYLRLFLPIIGKHVRDILQHVGINQLFVGIA